LLPLGSPYYSFSFTWIGHVSVVAYGLHLTQPLTLADFLAQYRDNPRYELADGELIDMEPTGPHKTVGGKLATQLGIAITEAQQPCPAED
jgi:Uma2 family endonuclease